ncbi:hypothetical protein IWQ62_000404 [Dispira parvispora]|uniref:RING-type E3 ubiquitin transferase n=1 Tax=Dispira parvispora TaxID=1520584 RepID=A0A9W8B1E5_9FUNG|nr:hypothetical protein IWQ62_000404 [Dispira parvispora]
MRLVVYGAVTTALTGMVLVSTFSQQWYFFAACVRLAQSNANLLILANMALFLTILTGKFMQRVFFGSLRAIEVEHLYERGWFAITETCLALTAFRDEYNTQTFFLLLTLMFSKVFHWLLEDRVGYMEQAPVLGWVFHVRTVAMAVLLGLTDVLFLWYSVHSMFIGENGMVLSILAVFGFEFTILVVSLAATVAKYLLHVLEQRSGHAWDSKSLYIAIIDLVSDFFQLVLYLAFFALITYYFHFPYHILFNIYATLRGFIQKCRILLRYRQATRNMNERYPTVTPEELSQLRDTTCIICREDMVHHEDDLDLPQDTEDSSDEVNQGEIPKRLPCGHVFHFNCLRSWLERQQTCPTCRQNVLESPTGQDRQPAADNVNPPAGPEAEPPTNRPGSGRDAPTSQPRFPSQGNMESPSGSTSSPSTGQSPYIPSANFTPRSQPWFRRRADSPAPQTQSPRADVSTESPRETGDQASSEYNVPAGDQGEAPGGTIQQQFFDPLLYATQPITSLPQLIPLVPVALTPPASLGDSSARSNVQGPPVQLTNEQLQRLASHSKAAIEERLRVLNNIQQTIWTSIAQLNQVLEVDNQLLRAATQLATPAESTGTSPATTGSRVEKTIRKRPSAVSSLPNVGRPMTSPTFSRTGRQVTAAERGVLPPNTIGASSAINANETRIRPTEDTASTATVSSQPDEELDHLVPEQRPTCASDTFDESATAPTVPSTYVGTEKNDEIDATSPLTTVHGKGKEPEA